jgi:hypothetical protein
MSTPSFRRIPDRGPAQAPESRIAEHRCGQKSKRIVNAKAWRIPETAENLNVGLGLLNQNIMKYTIKSINSAGTSEKVSRTD